MPRKQSKTLADYERRYHELLEEHADGGLVRAGSVAPRHNYCGKANCRCHGDPPELHGPYLQWTAKVDGKTVNRRLRPEEAELFRRVDRQRETTTGDARRVACPGRSGHRSYHREGPPGWRRRFNRKFRTGWVSRRLRSGARGSGLSPLHIRLAMVVMVRFRRRLSLFGVQAAQSQSSTRSTWIPPYPMPLDTDRPRVPHGTAPAPLAD